MSRRESVIAGGTDPRKAYLLKVASHILSLNLTEERLPNVGALNSFCNSDIPILTISRLDQKGHVDVGNELNNNRAIMLRVVFYKLRNKPLNLDDFKQNVSVLSMQGNAGETLLGSLKQVFSRILPNEEGGTEIANLMGELEENLQNNFGEGNGEEGGNVHSLRHEIEHWQKRAQKGNEQAQNFAEALEPLAEKLAIIEGDGQLDELYEMLEMAEQSVDALWNIFDEPYPQRRMRQLLIRIGESLCAAIVRRIPLNQLFQSSETLRLAVFLTAQWRDTVEMLTGKSWPENGLHPWEGASLKMEQLEKFNKRMEEAHSLTTLAEQIAQLMGEQSETDSNSQKEQIQQAIEGALANANPFEFGPHTEQQWQQRLNATERVLDPYIERIMPNLREKFQPNNEEDGQILVDELHRYRHFLGRKQVKEKLQAERHSLIGRLMAELTAQRRGMEKLQSSTNIPTGRFLTEIAAKISWIRSNLTRTEKMKKIGALFFDDLQTYSTLENSIRTLNDELKMAEEEHFDAWCRDMIAHVDDQNGDSISLQTTGRLMVLERARGTLTVSYSDRLARLLREVAQLRAMGFKVPAKILNCAKQGEKYYQYGVLLKQVAHFYNTIEQQMLPCQQAMLLDEAMAFERLVVPPSTNQQQKRNNNNGERETMNLTWENPDKLKAYIEKLSEAAHKLTSHNRRLRKAHAEIEQIVLGLGQTDLLREEEKWTRKLIEIRQKFVDEERFVAVKANMQPWVNHWNRQLYKIIQLQFRWALENLQAQLPSIYAQLVFRDQQLQLRPPLEELKQNYYKSLRKLLSIPQRLRGVQNTANEAEMFGRIVTRNGRRFHSLYEQSEQMFERVKTIVNSEFEQWTALAQVNLEDLLEQQLQNPTDWEEQFRLLRVKQREAERMPNEIRIECIRISTNGVRALIDDLLKRFHDALAWTLRHSIRSELQSIEQKLSQGIEKLSTLPQSLDEVAEANQTQLTLARSSAQIRTRMGIIEEKDELLRSLFGSDQGIGGLQPIRDQFMQFLSLLETHELVMREQVQTMKSNVGQSVKSLAEELTKLHSLWNQFKPKSEIFTSQDDRLALVKAMEFIREKRQEFDKLAKKLDKVRLECEQFELEQPQWPELTELREDLEQYESNYLLYEDFSNELQPLADQEWVLFRSKTFLFDEFLQQWMDKLKGTPGSNVAVRLQKDIEQMKEFSNCLKFCRGEIFGADHWLEMFRLFGLPRGTSLEKLTFGSLLMVQQKVVANLEKLKELNARAHGEISIREAIQELEMWAAQAEFALTDYRHSNGTALKIVKEWKPVLNQVRDNQALLQSLRSSPYYAQFREQIQLWEKKVADLEQNLHHLNEIQRKWVYLEPIFGRGSLPSEAARFNRIDVEFRAILGDISKDNRIASLRPALGQTLEQLVDQLNRCQRALNEFLEEKRNAFPRFYFLGDDDLLEIVGQSTNPAVIQSHLKKLYQGINRVAFDGQQQSIRAMISAEGESVQLLKPVQIVPKVEQWLSALSDEMRNTLRRLVVDCLQERALDPSRYPSQVLCLSEEIRFCSDVEKCLASLGGSPTEQLVAYRRQLSAQLERLSNTTIDDQIIQLKLKALILDLIHHIAVLDQLISAENNQSIGCWTWQRQLRFYLVSGLVVVRQAEYEFPYTYEYQGNAQKLVHTPLTDKCYLTLTQALAMGLGGNPYGPAGTGKTESVKALAGLMGRQVLVFNCDEGIDVQAIGRIFVGLIQCGAWGCFDEFNRLAKGVLSAVSSQVQIIQEAVRVKATHCRIGEHNVPVDTNSAIFVTMNPAGKGYGGRQRLPDNLKQLFRPVAMSVPDNEQIAETLLYAEGFQQAKVLAKKLVTTFELAKEMLSQQQHYDWGLRSLKTVLRGCSDAIGKKRLEFTAAKIQKLTPEEEFELVLQNLQLNTLSKLTFADARRFKVLLEDIFPEMPKQAMQFDELRPHLQKAAQQLQFSNITEIQMNKLFELYEQLRQRIGVIIVGPPGSGKSTLWRLLKMALSSIGEAVDVFSMNPKSMPRSRLLGHLEPDTREWADGTLTLAARMVTTNPTKPAWIVCDGDIDPEWIEALNSVLDDNRLLTIPSGERIQFGQNVNFIFECVNLAHASPATISRMGMILVSNEDLDLQELIKNFLSQNDKNMPAQFSDWVNSTLMPAFDWTFAHQNREFGCSQVGIIKNALSLVKNSKTRNQFLVNTFRALLPYVEPDSRRELAERVVFSGTNLPDPKSPLNVYCDSRVDSLVAYTDDIGLPFTLEEMRKTRPIVLTARMQSARDILMEWLNPNNAQHILIIGPDGCGKECLLKNCLEGGTLGMRRKLVTMHCGAYTNSIHLEQLLMEHCVQVSGSNGRAFKPKEDDQLLLHLKSANLSAIDAYGTSMLIAFLEQMLDYNGFYDRNLEWISLENIQLILSISSATGNERYSLPERFTSKLRILCLDAPSEAELRVIYGAYLLPILGQNTTNRSKCESLAANMANLFTELTKTFSVNDQFHYVFTPIDLTNWAYSLMRYDRNSELDLNNCLHFEALRIFGDRLISAEHRNRFQSILQDHFPIRDRLLFSPGFGPVLANKNATFNGKQMQPITKADYSSQLEKAMNRLKTEQTTPEQPLHDAFVEMCLAVDRALTASAGSILLAGRVGMGRRAAVTLVAQIHQMRLFNLRVSSAYSLRNFSQDLKDAIHSACVDNEQVVLMVEDYQLMDDAFLQFISSLVASGNIPGLYTNPQELDQLLLRLRDSAMEEGFAGSGLHDFFAHKIHQNVHVALLMNTGHPNFVSRILSNPPLYKHCNIIWQENWSAEIGTQIAGMALRQKGMEEPGQWLLSSFVQFYQRAPNECRIPAKFAVFVNNFHELMETKKNTIEKRLQRLKAGVDKLTETRTSVAKLQKKAAKKSKLLAEKQSEANAALAEITRSMTGATEQKADMEQLKSATEAENVKIEEQKKVIEKQLSEVEPLLKAAREAVGSIKTESLTEVRSLRAPPEAIRDILQAVLLFMGILDASWEAMRKFLAKSGVKEDIINFDARRITPDMAKKVGTLVKAKAASFDPKNAKRASAAAAPLAAWVTANLQYAIIIEKIAPLEQKKDSLVKNLNAAEKQMNELSKGLKSLDKKVDELKAKFEASMKEATEIKIDLDREEATIVVAGKLVERLGGEYARWQHQQKQLEAEMRTAENCCLIGAAFMTFLGGATEEIRSVTMREWSGLCQLPEGFDLLTFLASETEQLGWKVEGMPPNRLALENAAILFRTKETPFIIDPSGAITTFLLNHFNKISSSIELLRASQPDLMTQIELAVRFGKILIVDEVDDAIEPAIIPLLRKEFKSIGTRLAVQLGEKQVDFNDKFRLFLCTRNEHCHLAEHARGALTEINFSITRSGFASQLLGLAIQLEKPELERNSGQLSSQMESLKMQLDQIEQTLLEELAVSTGSLLENTSLLESLNESKEKADKVSEGLTQSQQLRAQIDSQRDAFLPFAQRCAQLYFAIRPLHSIKQCYQFSVNDCIALFRKFFVGGGEIKAGEEKDRLERTYRRLRLRLFEFVSRSLFKEDRLMFAMQFVHETAQPGIFARNEWELFTGMLHQTNEPSPNALISQIGWLEREKKIAVEKIQTHLPALFQAMQIGDQQTWAGFMKSTECENAYPPSVATKLSDFQRVLILQALRPDRLHSGIIRFASKILGVESLNAPTLNFASMHREESSAVQPILLLIAPGSSVDPTAELAEYAQKHFGGNQQKFHQMSLGQPGSEWTILDLLRKCTRNGDWLCLHNVHLVPSMAGKLLTEIGMAQKEQQLNAEFRLWLTAEPDEHLPVVFLQTCLKATYETPPGIRKNLERNYIGQPGNEAERNVPKLKAIFLLHWLNAVAQERRNFIPQSWLKFYEFSGADLRAAKHSLDSQFAIKEKANLRSVDWEQFRGLMMNAIYGGRIEIELDNRVLLAFLKELFNTKMVDGNGGELAVGLKMPIFGQYSEYCKWIESTLPVNDRAELLWLPRNIMLSWDMAQSGNVISKLRLIITASALTNTNKLATNEINQNAFNRQLWTDSLNPLLNLWKRLNQQHPELLKTAQQRRNSRPISATQIGQRAESSGNKINRASDDPLTEILQLEFIYSLNLMQFIHSSLSAISRAIKGNELPEKKTIEIAQSLLQFQIPTAWDALWTGPTVPTQYLESLIYKVKSTQTLLISAQSKQLLSSKINLAQLFRPGTLLNAFRQYSARKMKKSMDSLQLATSWQVDGQITNEAQNAPTLTLRSLRIQGALFDGRELRTVTPSASPFSEIPNLNIYWTEESQNEQTNSLSLPLFADIDRRESILQISVPCAERQKNLWILAGVALFLNAD